MASMVSDGADLQPGGTYLGMAAARWPGVNRALMGVMVPTYTLVVYKYQQCPKCHHMEIILGSGVL